MQAHRRSSAGSDASRRLRDERLAAAADSSSSDESRAAASIYSDGPAYQSESEDEKRRRAAKRIRRRETSALETRIPGHDASSDDDGFIVDGSSDDEGQAEEEDAAMQSGFSHFAFDLEREQARQSLELEQGLGLLAEAGEQAGSWSRWSRDESFEWYMRFLAAAVAWQMAPALLRAQPLSVDARAYICGVRKWEGPLMMAKNSLVESQAWAGKSWVKQRLESLPCLTATEDNVGLASHRCEICERRNHPASVQLVARGLPASYDGNKVWDAAVSLGDSTGGRPWESFIPRGDRHSNSSTAASGVARGHATGGAAASTTGQAAAYRCTALDQVTGPGGGAGSSDEASESASESDAAEVLPGDLVDDGGVLTAKWKAGKFCAYRVTLFSQLVHWKMTALVRAAGVITSAASMVTTSDDAGSEPRGAPPAVFEDETDSDGAASAGKSSPRGELDVLTVAELHAVFSTPEWRDAVRAQRALFEALMTAAQGNYAVHAASVDAVVTLSQEAAWSCVLEDLGRHLSRDFIPTFSRGLPAQLACSAAGVRVGSPGGSGAPEGSALEGDSAAGNVHAVSGSVGRGSVRRKRSRQDIARESCTDRAGAFSEPSAVPLVPAAAVLSGGGEGESQAQPQTGKRHTAPGASTAALALQASAVGARARRVRLALVMHATESSSGSDDGPTQASGRARSPSGRVGATLGRLPAGSGAAQPVRRALSAASPRKLLVEKSDEGNRSRSSAMPG